MMNWWLELNGSSIGVGVETEAAAGEGWLFVICSWLDGWANNQQHTAEGFVLPMCTTMIT